MNDVHVSDRGPVPVPSAALALRRARRGALGLGAALLLLGACSLLPVTPAISLYSLEPTGTAGRAVGAPAGVAGGAGGAGVVDASSAAAGSAGTVEQVAWRLAVARPDAGGQLNNPRILVMPRPGELEVYPRAQWADAPPRLLADQILDDLTRSGRILGVDRAGAGLSTDFELASTLQAFQVEIREGRAAAVVRLQARLIARPENRIIAARLFEVSAPAASQQAEVAVRAFDEAVGTLLPQVREWTLAEGQRHWAARPMTATPRRP